MAAGKQNADFDAQSTISTADTLADGAYLDDTMTRYNMYYTTSRLNLRLCEAKGPNTPATYYAESKISTTAPRYLLRKGDSSRGEVVAFARAFSLTTQRHAQIGLGDYRGAPYGDGDGEASVEKLVRDRNQFRRSDYRFSTSVGSETGKKVEFVWHKDRHHWGATVYQALDEDGNVVARLLSGGAWNLRKGGEAYVARDLHEDLRHLLIISAIAVWTIEAFAAQSQVRGFEKEREKAAHGRGSAGGGDAGSSGGGGGVGGSSSKGGDGDGAVGGSAKEDGLE